jgi:hypothetical protein
MQVDVTLLREREQNRQAELQEHIKAQKALREEVEASQLKAEAAEDSRKAAEEKLEGAQEEIERLQKHVADLESRKRPPLYQRKQEEELQVRSSMCFMRQAVFCFSTLHDQLLQIEVLLISSMLPAHVHSTKSCGSSLFGICMSGKIHSWSNVAGCEGTCSRV